MSNSNEMVAPAFICRCEERTAQDLRDAIEAGARTINDVKRRTRAGMGICQGAYCLNHVADLVQRELGQPRELVAPMTARPPVRVLTLSSLAHLGESD
jgi:NAD(P)H-nitrite reductase large subunit